jgi:hypothetical protein
MNETKPKKMVRRSVAMGLVVICIMLTASMVGIVIFFIPAHNQVSNLQSQLNDANDNLTAVLNLNKSIVLVNGEEATQQNSAQQNSFSEWDLDQINYSGYITVWVNSVDPLSSAQTVWVELSYVSPYLKNNYDEKQTLSDKNILGFLQDYASFPVLPTEPESFYGPVVVKVGTNLGFNATEKVTITYYY